DLLPAAPAGSAGYLLRAHRRAARCRGRRGRGRCHPLGPLGTVSRPDRGIVPCGPARRVAGRVRAAGRPGAGGVATPGDRDAVQGRTGRGHPWRARGRRRRRLTRCGFCLRRGRLDPHKIADESQDRPRADAPRFGARFRRVHAHRVPHSLPCGAWARLLRRGQSGDHRQGPEAPLATVRARSGERGRGGTAFRAARKRTRAVMTDAEGPHVLEPVHVADGEADGKQWSYRLVVFLRVMAAVSLCKGLYHWAIICGIAAPFPSGFDSYSTPYQVATVVFPIIDL